MSNIGVPNKQYGLIVKSKEIKPPPKKLAPSCFNVDSDEEDEFTKINFDKALSEDPTVFEYDEIYDKISSEQQKLQADSLEKKAAKPKYIENLLKQSAVRKLERELLQERKAHNDIEAEKEKFKDKEAFVTSAYKEKMKELHELVEKRREEESRENLMDVTKQDGLGGFYRYMYDKDLTSRVGLYKYFCFYSASTKLTAKRHRKKQKILKSRSLTLIMVKSHCIRVHDHQTKENTTKKKLSLLDQGNSNIATEAALKPVADR
ncbi:Nuclear speckle splicing regulatory protein 1 [Cichlidogyrus casuarinus]|uniref:Nuclear speckle splicing regulatory protein 1 n=1 Tax=Cichlidogyrus casuarinus TaxID=1844966 RepID=A0ABD2QCQ3_9PLAT